MNRQILPRFIYFLTFLLAISARVEAQDLSVNVDELFPIGSIEREGLSSSPSFTPSQHYPDSDTSSFSLLRWQQGYQVLPSYARQNPSGYSYLCHLELKAEDKLPIGVWVKIDDGKESLVPRLPQTYLQFKLLRF